MGTPEPQAKAQAKDNGIVVIHGREYKTVALRVQEFRADHTIEDGWAILTRVVGLDEKTVVVEAKIVTPAGIVVGLDYAEEVRGSSTINRTSALENCCTSAIGRALSACGFGGSEYASADELVRALEQQKTAGLTPGWTAPTPQSLTKRTQGLRPAAPGQQACPDCAGAMWDNRNDKRNPRAPDYKCKDKTCGKGVWLTPFTPQQELTVANMAGYGEIESEEAGDEMPF